MTSQGAAANDKRDTTLRVHRAGLKGIDIAWVLLFLEVLMNLGAGPVMMLAPELILESFGPADDTADLVAKEAQRWFGVMCFVFGGVYLGTMLFGQRIGFGAQPQQSVNLLLKVFLLADIMYVSIFINWCVERKYWNAACVCNVIFGAVLPLARLAVLFSRRADANETQPLIAS